MLHFIVGKVGDESRNTFCRSGLHPNAGNFLRCGSQRRNSVNATDFIDQTGIDNRTGLSRGVRRDDADFARATLPIAETSDDW